MSCHAMPMTRHVNININNNSNKKPAADKSCVIKEQQRGLDSLTKEQQLITPKEENTQRKRRCTPSMVMSLSARANVNETARATNIFPLRLKIPAESVRCC